MTVKRRAAPADESGRFFRGAAVRASVLGDRELVGDDERVGQGQAEAGSALPGRGDARVYAFSIRRPDVDVGSIRSEMDLRYTPRSRSRFTVFKTSIKDRPSRSTRHTTTVSPGSTYARSFFIPGRSIAALLPEVTSASLSFRDTRIARCSAGKRPAEAQRCCVTDAQVRPRTLLIRPSTSVGVVVKEVTKRTTPGSHRSW